MAGDSIDKNDPINQILDKAKPILSKVSFGSIVGYCSGAAAKKVGKAIAIVLGLGFIAIQSGKEFLWYKDYVHVSIIVFRITELRFFS